LTDCLDVVRYNASLIPESSAWLNALPSSTIGLLLDNNTFRISVSLRLGTDICVPHNCKCGMRVESNGIHGLSCSMSTGRHSRHSALNEIILRSLASVKCPAVLEPTGLARDDGKRPDGMTLVPWMRGQMLVWDATCSDTLAPSNLPLSRNSIGSVAEAAADRKKKKYNTIISRNHIFIPFAVETFGPWCNEARDFVQSVGKRLRSITGEPRSTNYLRQRISIAIQRGNAASVMGSLPPTGSMEEIFYLL
jgi:hypothetical protein